MFDFHHTGQIGEQHLAGLAKFRLCGPFSLPPQTTAVPSGACWTSTLTSFRPAYEPLGYTGNIAWHPFFLNSRKRFCSAVLYCTRHPFGHCVTHCYSVTYGADKDLRNRRPFKYHLRLNPRRALGPFSTCQWSYSLESWNLCWVLSQCNWLINRWNCKGPKYPTKVGISSR